MSTYIDHNDMRAEYGFAINPFSAKVIAPYKIVNRNYRKVPTDLRGPIGRECICLWD